MSNVPNSCKIADLDFCWSLSSLVRHYLFTDTRSEKLLTSPRTLMIKSPGQNRMRTIRLVILIAHHLHRYFRDGVRRERTKWSNFCDRKIFSSNQTILFRTSRQKNLSRSIFSHSQPFQEIRSHQSISFKRVSRNLKALSHKRLRR